MITAKEAKELYSEVLSVRDKYIGTQMYDSEGELIISWE